MNKTVNKIQFKADRKRPDRMSELDLENVFEGVDFSYSDDHSALNGDAFSCNSSSIENRFAEESALLCGIASISIHKRARLRDHCCSEVVVRELFVPIYEYYRLSYKEIDLTPFFETEKPTIHCSFIHQSGFICLHITAVFRQAVFFTTLITSKTPLFSTEQDNLNLLLDTKWFKIVTLILYCLIAVTGLLGNTLFCYVIWKSKKLHQVTHMLMTNLGAANIVFIFFHAPFFITKYILNDGWTLGKWEVF